MIHCFLFAGQLSVHAPTILQGELRVIGADCLLTGSLEVTGSSTLLAMNIPSSTGSPAIQASATRAVFTVPMIVDEEMTVNSVITKGMIASNRDDESF
eukprot:SAG31_NODE_26718_length_437_cov_1.671598_1_plen_97_part_10